MHTLRAVAIACNSNDPAYRDEDQVTFSTDSPPKVQVTLRRDRGRVEGILTYDMGNGANWSLGARELRWRFADGTISNGSPIPVPAPSTRTGSVPFTVIPPRNARQLVVMGVVQTCKGRATAEASIDCDDCEAATGDPVYLADGNVRVTDTDPLPGIAGQALVRTYDSDEQDEGSFGRGWTTFLDRRLVVDADGAEQIVSIVTARNEVVTFRGAGTSFRQTWPTASTVGTLRRDPAADTYTHRAAGSTEAAVFRGADGRLLTLRDLSTGREARLVYDSSGQVSSVIDSWTGLTWVVTVHPGTRRIASITVAGDPELLWTYAYDASGNLTAVTAPNAATWRTYEYEANRMTASRDALGNLIESHTYDGNGFGISSTGPNDEIASIEYGLPGVTSDERVTRVTYKTGAIAEYALRPSGGAYRVATVTGGCASCGASDATFVRDERGRVIREQDARGYVSLRDYDPLTHNLIATSTFRMPGACDPATDPARCRKTPEQLAALTLVEMQPTRSTLTTRSEYGDPAWPDRPTAMRTESIVTVLSRRGPIDSSSSHEMDRVETWARDAATGTVLTHTISGWSDGVYKTRINAASLYDGLEGAAFTPGGSFDTAWLTLPQPAGLIELTDGLRTDVADTTSFVYYPVHTTVPPQRRGRLAATKNALGHIVRYDDYDRFGNVTRSTDPNGVITEWAYDALGRLLSSTIKGTLGCDTSVDALCAADLTQTRIYDGAGPLRSESRPGGGATVYAYDTRGRVASVSRGPSTADLRERMVIAYDSLTGRKNLSTAETFEGGAWVEKHRQAYAYDTRGLLAKVTHADGAFVEYSYGEAQQLTGVSDENHSSASGSVFNTRYGHGPSGLLERVTQSLAGAPDGEVVTRYGYDLRGNLAGVIDPNGNSTAYFYDDFDQLTATISPVTGTTSYTYDEAGQLVSTTDANGAVTTRAYDALGRVVRAVSTLAGRPTETVTWTYDIGPLAIGRLSSLSDPAGTTTYSYERRGLVRQETRAFAGGPDLTTKYAYDRDGNRNGIVYPSNQLAVTYVFDYAGRPRSASGFVTDAGYHPFGPLTRLQFANGTTQTLEYDTRYRMTKNQLVIDGLPPAVGTIAKSTYEHDGAGNIVGILAGDDPEYHRHFGYDELQRLVTANTGPDRNAPRVGATALWGRGKFTWDLMGNLLTMTLGEIEKSPDPEPLRARRPRRPPDTAATVPLGRSVELQYEGSTPRVAAAVNDGLSHGVTIDAAGNETSYYVTRTYSARNLLEQVIDTGDAEGAVPHVVTYAYDGRGVRVRRTESPAEGPGTSASRYSTYAPELRLLSVTGDDAPNVWESHHAPMEMVWFGERPVGQVTPGAPLRYTFSDHLGTPILQTDGTASVVWRVEYEPFGNVYAVRAGRRTDQPLRFPGQDLATTWEGPEESYNIFRWYRAGWGRYTQSDPIGLRGGTNLYAYVEGNPINFTDPLGLKVYKCCRYVQVNPFIDLVSHVWSSSLLPENRHA